MLAAATVVAASCQAGPVSGGTAATGIHKIQHVIVIMQENRSFDSYFGTYPGADGFPRDQRGKISVCVPDPRNSVCMRPYHDKSNRNFGGPHDHIDAMDDI